MGIHVNFENGCIKIGFGAENEEKESKESPIVRENIPIAEVLNLLPRYGGHLKQDMLIAYDENEDGSILMEWDYMSAKYPGLKPEQLFIFTVEEKPYSTAQGCKIFKCCQAGEPIEDHLANLRDCLMTHPLPWHWIFDVDRTLLNRERSSKSGKTIINKPLLKVTPEFFTPETTCSVMTAREHPLRRHLDVLTQMRNSQSELNEQILGVGEYLKLKLIIIQTQIISFQTYAKSIQNHSPKLPATVAKQKILTQCERVLRLIDNTDKKLKDCINKKVQTITQKT